MNAIPQNSVRREGESLVPVASPLLDAPTTAPAQTNGVPPTSRAERESQAEKAAAQKVIDDGDVKAMLASCLPTLRAELYAAEFMHAEITRARDIQTRKRKFLKAAGKITGGLPPMTETALRVVANSPKA